MRCPDYDPENVYWQRVKRLLEDQEYVLKKIREYNEIKIKEPTTVAPIMNQASPEKSIPSTVYFSESVSTSASHSSSLNEMRDMESVSASVPLSSSTNEKRNTHKTVTNTGTKRKGVSGNNNNRRVSLCKK